MKIFTIKDVAAISSYFALFLVFSLSSLTYARDGDNGRHSGYEQGNHKGHSNEHGKHKGHENVRNPWYRIRFSKATSGADIELTIHHHGMSPPLTFTATYDSMMTIQEVLDDILVDPTGFYFQECFMTTTIFGQILTDCTEGENPVPMNSSLTLQNAGLVEDPEVYLLFSLN